MAVAAFGTRLQINTDAIVELKSISGLEISVDTIDTTALDSGGWRTFIQGLRDGGEVSCSGHFNPSDTKGQKALYDSLMAGNTLSLSIVFPSGLGATWTFNGVVVKFATGAEMEAVVSFETTIKVSGIPTLSTTASAGLSALAVTGGTLAPVFASNKYAYTVAALSGTTFTVTPTGGGQSIRLFVDGVLTKTMASGEVGTVNFANVGDSKKITLSATEVGKSTILYDIVVVRTV